MTLSITTSAASKILLGDIILIFHDTDTKKKKKQTRLPITETLLNFGADIAMGFQKALDELWIQPFLTVLPSLHLS